MSAKTTTDSQPPRVIGLAGSALINLNAVIGAGIFALPALLYAGTGSLAPLVVLAFAVPVAASIAVVAKLSMHFDESGGPQLYVERAMGRFMGFLVGLFVLGQNLAARAANFHVLVAYLAAIFPVFDPAPIRLGVILALIAGFTLMGITGTRRSIGALGIGTLLKIGPILIICMAGLAINGLPQTYVMPEFGEVEAIALLLAYAYSGVTLAAIPAGEITDARRTVAHSMFVTLAIIALFYTFVQGAYIAIDPRDVDMERPLASAADAVLGQTGIILISLAAIFSTGTNQLSYFVSMPRLIFAMGRRRMVPALLAKVSVRFGTPANAIGVYGLLVAGLALTGTFATLAIFMVALETLANLLVIIALAILWRHDADGIGAAMRWPWLVLIAFALAFNVWLLLQAPASAIVPTLVVIVLIAGLYRFGPAKLA